VIIHFYTQFECFSKNVETITPSDPLSLWLSRCRSRLLARAASLAIKRTLELLLLLLPFQMLKLVSVESERARERKKSNQMQLLIASKLVINYAN
jgi:hypothetical protein